MEPKTGWKTKEKLFEVSGVDYFEVNDKVLEAIGSFIDEVVSSDNRAVSITVAVEYLPAPDD
jgi:hypothetical protein